MCHSVQASWCRTMATDPVATHAKTKTVETKEEGAVASEPAAEAKEEEAKADVDVCSDCGAEERDDGYCDCLCSTCGFRNCVCDVDFDICGGCGRAYRGTCNGCP